MVELGILGMSKRTTQIFLLWIFTSFALGFYYDNIKESVSYGQFYPSLVRLAKNSQAMTLAFTHWVCCSYLLAKFLIKVFLGPLRAIEIENVQSNFWMAITDIALTLMLFHGETEKSPVSFVMLLTSLLIIKTLHWLYSDRISFMETSPIITWKYRIRMIGLTLFLFIIDLSLVYYSYEMYQKKKIFFLIFLCEYALLTIKTIYTFIQFILHSIDLASSSPWENKNMYMMYFKLVLSSFRCIVQVSFLYYLSMKARFPLYQLRPVIMEIKIMKNTLRDIVNSKKAIKKMQNFTTAKIEDFTEDKDVTCIICHEDMVNEKDAPPPKEGEEPKPKIKFLTGEIKKLPCGHMFHSSCLRSWFMRQQTCPICRASVLTADTGAAGAAAAGGFRLAGGRLAGARVAGGAAAGDAGNNNPNRDARRIQRLIQNIRNNPVAGLRGLNVRVNGVNANADNNNVTGSSSTAGSTLNLGNTASNIDDLYEDLPEIINRTAKSVPVPKVPINLSELMKLDAIELQEMEKQEKKAIVKRIEFLRNIRTMCDASISMMSQYDSLLIKDMPLDDVSLMRQRAMSIGKVKTEASTSKSSENTNKDQDKAQNDALKQLLNEMGIKIEADSNIQDFPNKLTEMENKISQDKNRLQNEIKKAEDKISKMTNIKQESKDEKDESSSSSKIVDIDMDKYEKEPEPSLKSMLEKTQKLEADLKTRNSIPSLNSSSKIVQNNDEEKEKDQDDDQGDGPTLNELRKRRLASLNR